MTVTLKRMTLMGLLAASFFALAFRAETDDPLTWNRKAAASYLDARQTWWMKLARGRSRSSNVLHLLPYSCALRTRSPRAPCGTRRKRAVRQRAQAPRQCDQARSCLERHATVLQRRKSSPDKTPQSRGTESILNALILARS